MGTKYCDLIVKETESTGWDSNPRPRLTRAESSPLDDQCLHRSGTGGARTLTEPVKSRTFCRENFSPVWRRGSARKESNLRRPVISRVFSR